MTLEVKGSWLIVKDLGLQGLNWQNEAGALVLGWKVHGAALGAEGGEMDMGGRFQGDRYGFCFAFKSLFERQR